MWAPSIRRHDGWYWIFAPAGGLATGWQLAMRARAPLGPDEARTVLAQGATAVNGPHQGAWVSLAIGEHWFLHFQNRGACGRVVHLQPMRWRSDGWPVIGAAEQSDTTGTPVLRNAMPNVGSIRVSAGGALPTTDAFSAPRLGLQWQWQANPDTSWYALDRSRHPLRLTAQSLSSPGRNLWDAPNLLLQKFPSDSFDVTTKFTVAGTQAGESFGLIVFGLDYAWVGVRQAPQDTSRWELVFATVHDADKGTAEGVQVLGTFARADVAVRLRVGAGAKCRFSYSVAGAPFVEVPTDFSARQGRWVGAKFGLFASRRVASPSTRATGAPGTMRVSSVRVTHAPSRTTSSPAH